MQGKIADLMGFFFFFWSAIREVEQGYIAQEGTATNKRRERGRTGWAGIHKRGGTLNIYMRGERGQRLVYSY